MIERDEYPLRPASWEEGQQTAPARIPYQNHSTTSHEAARLMAPKVSALELEILNFFAECALASGEGLTDDELIIAFGTQSARPRRIFLTHIGKLHDSGATRKTRSGRRAVVWSLA
mgnify:CR=1 FL=1